MGINSLFISLGKFLCSPIERIKEILKDHSVSQDAHKSNADDIKGRDGDVVVGDRINTIHLHDDFDVVWKKGIIKGKSVVRTYGEDGLVDKSTNIHSERGSVQISGRNTKVVEVISPSLEKVIMSKFANGNVKINEGLETKRFGIEIVGSGTVNCDDVEICGQLYVEISGSGSVSVSGHAHSANLFVKGSGNINTYHLNADYVNAVIDGSGDILCNPQKELDGAVYGSGCIRYKGNPVMSVGGTKVVKIP